jgi:hypothetical protein
LYPPRPSDYATATLSSAIQRGQTPTQEILLNRVESSLCNVPVVLIMEDFESFGCYWR